MVFLLWNCKVQKRNSVGDHTECLAGALKAWLLFLLSPPASCENFGRHVGFPAIKMTLRIICYMLIIGVWLRGRWQFHRILFMATESKGRKFSTFALTERILFHPDSRFSWKWSKNSRMEMKKWSEWWENTLSSSKENLWLYSLDNSSGEEYTLLNSMKPSIIQQIIYK